MSNWKSLRIFSSAGFVTFSNDFLSRVEGKAPAWSRIILTPHLKAVNSFVRDFLPGWLTSFQAWLSSSRVKPVGQSSRKNLVATSDMGGVPLSVLMAIELNETFGCKRGWGCFRSGRREVVLQSLDLFSHATKGPAIASSLPLLMADDVGHVVHPVLQMLSDGVC